MLPALFKHFFPGVKPVTTFDKSQSTKIMSSKHNPFSVCFWHYSETKHGPWPGHKAEVRVFSQIPRAGVGMCQHSHTALVSFQSQQFDCPPEACPQTSPEQHYMCMSHLCGSCLCYITSLLTPSLWVFGKSCCIALGGFYSNKMPLVSNTFG